MSFRSFNLNLLLVFEAMMEHRNTTKAGRSLGLTQSAVSNSLVQLRKTLNDPLFVRHHNEMAPTQRALELEQPVAAALRQLRSAIESSDRFDAARSSRVFRIGMSDYSAYVMLDRIVAELRAQSGSVRITVRNVGSDDIAEAVERDEVDVCIGFADRSGGHLRGTTLFEDQWVCARRGDGQERGGEITLDQYLAAQHVVIGTDLSNHVDRMLARQDLARMNAVSLPFCLAAPLLIEATDLLLTLPRRIAEQFQRGRRIEICELPFPAGGFPVIMLWHERSDHNPAQRWLRSLIASASAGCRALPSAPEAAAAELVVQAPHGAPRSARVASPGNGYASAAAAGAA